MVEGPGSNPEYPSTQTYKSQGNKMEEGEISSFIPRGSGWHRLHRPPCHPNTAGSKAHGSQDKLGSPSRP